jgi:hypothetical protein
VETLAGVWSNVIPGLGGPRPAHFGGSTSGCVWRGGSGLPFNPVMRVTVIGVGRELYDEDICRSRKVGVTPRRGANAGPADARFDGVRGHVLLVETSMRRSEACLSHLLLAWAPWPGSRFAAWFQSGDKSIVVRGFAASNRQRRCLLAGAFGETPWRVSRVGMSRDVVEGTGGLPDRDRASLHGLSWVTGRPW